MNFVGESSNSYFQCKLPTAACSGGKDRKTCVHNLFIESLIPGKQGTCIISTLNTGQTSSSLWFYVQLHVSFSHLLCSYRLQDANLFALQVEKWKALQFQAGALQVCLSYALYSSMLHIL